MRGFFIPFYFFVALSLFGFNQNGDVLTALKTIKDPTYKFLSEASPNSWKVSVQVAGSPKPLELLVSSEKGVVTVEAPIQLLDARPSLRLSEFLVSLNNSPSLGGFFTTRPTGTQFLVEYVVKLNFDYASTNALAASLADAASTANGFWETTLQKQQ